MFTECKFAIPIGSVQIIHFSVHIIFSLLLGDASFGTESEKNKARALECCRNLLRKKYRSPFLKFTALPQLTLFEFFWSLTCVFLCFFTLAKFDRIVSCWTNSNDYLIIRRAKNRSQSFEALTINPEKQIKGKGGMRQWRISWAFSRNGTMTEKEKKFFYSSREYFSLTVSPF